MQLTDAGGVTNSDESNTEAGPMRVSLGDLLDHDECVYKVTGINSSTQQVQTMCIEGINLAGSVKSSALDLVTQRVAECCE